MKRLLLVFIFIGAFGRLLLAQGTCTDVLREAQQHFDDGLLGDIPSLLEDCMKEGFTDEEKSNAYKLLIQTHLFSEEFELADEVMLDFLSEFPDYTLAANDPTEFVNLYQTYRTDPIFKVEANAGLIFDIPIPQYIDGVSNITSRKGEYSLKPGLNVEVNYVNTLSGSYDYSAGLSFYYTTLGYSETPYDYMNIDATFKGVMVGLPLSLRYNLPVSFFDLYAKVGIEPVYLISYKADITTAEDFEDDAYQGTETLTPFHKVYDLYPSLGVGALFDIGRGQLVFSLGYKFGVFESQKDGTRFKNEYVMKRYKFIEDNLIYNKAQFSLSYIRPIYNPKKIR